MFARLKVRNSAVWFASLVSILPLTVTNLRAQTTLKKVRVSIPAANVTIAAQVIDYSFVEKARKELSAAR
jgi:hypothetical protein